MSFLNSIKNNSKKYETPFDHWEYSNALSEGAIEEIVKADIPDLSQHNLNYDGTRAIDGGAAEFREGISNGGKAIKFRCFVTKENSSQFPSLVKFINEAKYDDFGAQTVVLTTRVREIQRFQSLPESVTQLAAKCDSMGDKAEMLHSAKEGYIRTFSVCMFWFAKSCLYDTSVCVVRQKTLYKGEWAGSPAPQRRGVSWDAAQRTAPREDGRV